MILTHSIRHLVHIPTKPDLCPMLKYCPGSAVYRLRQRKNRVVSPMGVNIARDKKVAFHPVNTHRMKNNEIVTTPLNPSSHR